MDAVPPPSVDAHPRTAVVLARPGEAGARETLKTLESLIGAWDAAADWDVAVVGVQDSALRQLSAALDGDVRWRWDPVAAAEEVAAARLRGRQVHVLAAGDAAPPEPGTRPLRVPLVDQLFGGESGSTFFAETDGSGALRWDRTFDPELRQDVVVFTNLSVNRVFEYRAARRVAWLLESPEVYPQTTEFVVQNARFYDLVVTNDRELAQRLPRAVHVPAAGCWVPPERQAVSVKTEWCSMIASRKAVTSGHQARLRLAEVAQAAGVHVFGRGFAGVDGFGELVDKADGLVSYRYSITVENCRVPGYFSEKLIDCFRTGTIPVYWGDPLVTEVFDPAGMLLVEDERDLPRVLAQATADHYERARPAVEENFRRAAAYRVVEDRLHPLLEPFAMGQSTAPVRSGVPLVGPMG